MSPRTIRPITAHDFGTRRHGLIPTDDDSAWVYQIGNSTIRRLSRGSELASLQLAEPVRVGARLHAASGHVVFAGHRQQTVVNANGEIAAVISAPACSVHVPHPPVWSADGTRLFSIACKASNVEITAYDARQKTVEAASLALATIGIPSAVGLSRGIAICSASTTGSVMTSVTNERWPSLDGQWPDLDVLDWCAEYGWLALQRGSRIVRVGPAVDAPLASDGVDAVVGGDGELPIDELWGQWIGGGRFILASWSKVWLCASNLQRLATLTVGPGRIVDDGPGDDEGDVVLHPLQNKNLVVAGNGQRFWVYRVADVFSTR